MILCILGVFVDVKILFFIFVQPFPMPPNVAIKGASVGVIPLPLADDMVDNGNEIFIIIFFL